VNYRIFQDLSSSLWNLDGNLEALEQQSTQNLVQDVEKNAMNHNCS
jgi:hypothetical protein